MSASVPCNGCTACCANDLLILHPECGDVASHYLTMPVINPITGKPATALQHKPEGGCVYLTDSGCSIHGRAPAICREFDCRRMFQKLGASQARKAVAAGLASQEVMDAGRKRRFTLERAA